MSRHVMMLGIVISIALIAGIAAAEPNFKPGKWEISTEMDMPGMPMKMPPMTHTQCLTKEDFVPKGQDASSDECQVTEIKQEGDTVSWKITCSGEGGKMEGTGQMTYNGDTMEGTMNMTMPDAGMTVKNTMTGKRIADCD